MDNLLLDHYVLRKKKIRSGLPLQIPYNLRWHESLVKTFIKFLMFFVLVIFLDNF